MKISFETMWLRLLVLFLTSSLMPVEADIVAEWVVVDFQFPNASMREDYIQSGRFAPKTIQVSGLAVDASKDAAKPTIYVTVPKIGFTDGVPSGLNTVHYNAATKKSYLVAYPSWEENVQGDCNVLLYPTSTVLDPNTGFLWVIDGGRTAHMTTTPQNLCPAKLVVYDTWNGGKKHMQYEFPDSVISRTSNFLNDITLDYVDPDSPRGVRYVYMSDTLDFRVIVFDVDNRESWYFTDASMGPSNPNVIMHGETFVMPMGVNGVCLTPSFNYFYFSIVAGKALYQVPTWVLRKKDSDIKSFIRKVGDKISQADGIFCGHDGIYYGAEEEDALYKWERTHDMAAQHTSEGRVTLQTQTQLAQNWETMQWVDAVTMDQRKRIYFTTSRAQLFYAGTMDFTGKDGSNCRILVLQGDDPSYLDFDKIPVIG